MDDWKKVLAESITKPKDLARHLGVDPKEIEDVVGAYPMRITPTVLATIKEKGDAIWKQVVPEAIEMEDFDAPDDPLEEDTDRNIILSLMFGHFVNKYTKCPVNIMFLSSLTENRFSRRRAIFWII